MEMALVFVIGLLVGSFLNVCIYRLPRDLSVVRPRSFCPECEHTVVWFDNIPLLSYVVLRGRCRRCGWHIPWRYPAVELLTGALFAVALWKFGWTPAAVTAAIFAAVMVELTFSDLESRILPDEFTVGGIVVGILIAIWAPMEEGFAHALLFPRQGALVSVVEALVGAAFASGALWLVGWLYQKVRHREGLGFGDVKMIALMGAFLGLHQTLLVLIIGSVLGSIVGLAYIMLARKDAGSYELPYGTFLGIAALAYVFAWPV
jgi:leader peptidase (prepilin peptidase)/N-methyltransferase